MQQGQSSCIASSMGIEQTGGLIEVWAHLSPCPGENPSHGNRLFGPVSTDLCKSKWTCVGRSDLRGDMIWHTAVPLILPPSQAQYVLLLPFTPLHPLPTLLSHHCLAWSLPAIVCIKASTDAGGMVQVFTLASLFSTLLQFVYGMFVTAHAGSVVAAPAQGVNRIMQLAS